MPKAKITKEIIGEATKTPEGFAALLNGYQAQIDGLAEQITTLELEIATRPSEFKAPSSAIKSHEDLMKAELESLEKDPKPHIARKVKAGLPEKKAAEWAIGRIAFLKATLGVKLIAFLALTFGCLFTASADQQGLPQTFIPATNMPAILLPGATTGYQEYSPSNFIQLRVNSGLGIQEIFGGVPLTNYNAPFTTFLFPMIDGTNAATQPQFVFASSILASNGIVCVDTNYSQLQLKGVWGYEYMISNGSGANVYFAGGFTNTTITTSNQPTGGLLFNRPNQ